MKTLTKNLKIRSCSNDTIAQSKGVFLYIDSDFKNWNLDTISPETKEINAAVLEMDKDANLKDMFGSISKNTDAMCMTQAQILRFIQDHKDQLKTDGYSTFFLFKENDEFFVARVYFDDDGRLGVGVFRLSLDYVWGAEYRRRIVVPQLALESSESDPLNSFDPSTLVRIEEKLDLLLKHFNN